MVVQCFFASFLQDQSSTLACGCCARIIRFKSHCLCIFCFCFLCIRSFDSYFGKCFFGFHQMDQPSDSTTIVDLVLNFRVHFTGHVSTGTGAVHQRRQCIRTGCYRIHCIGFQYTDQRRNRIVGTKKSTPLRMNGQRCHATGARFSACIDRGMCRCIFSCGFHQNIRQHVHNVQTIF